MKKRYLLSALAVLMTAGCSHIQIIDPSKDGLSSNEHFSLAAIYEKKNENELALNEYRKAISDDPANANAWFGLGNYHLRQNQLKDAIVSYKKAVEYNPGNGTFHNNLGWAYMEAGELENAERAVREAIKIDPQREHIYYDTLGVIQMKKKEFSSAEHSFQYAVKVSPPEDKNGLKQIYTHLEELYTEAGDLNSAEEAAGRVNALDDQQ